MDLPPFWDIVLVVSGAVVAGFVNGLSGTGYALVSLGFWLHAMPPVVAAPLAACCAVTSHITSLRAIWNGVSWPRLWPFLAGGLAGVPIGTALLTKVHVQPLKLGVGLLLIIYCSWMAFVRRPPIVTGGGRIADAAIGLTGGIMGGMASISGPAPTIWAQLRGWDMHQQRGVSQPFNMTILMVSFTSALVAGYIDRTFLIWVALAVPSTLLGARVGVSLYGRINGWQFRRIVLTLLGISGVTLVMSGFR
ncbi:MAG: sulfite exporter TauE/SafE family protein [Proteobacteria bacterium]|nr:sulfite exporter TauE/SafE family protein [Pseudomonadota bacterium]